jgi:hypothetical protein
MQFKKLSNKLTDKLKRMQEERLPKLIMEWIPGERRKRYIFCLMVEASDHGYVLRTRRIYVFNG